MKRKLFLLLCALLTMIGVQAQTDVTASYIGNLDAAAGKNGEPYGHAESNGIGWWNSQTTELTGWHAFVKNGEAFESWTGSFGGAGAMIGRTMVLPAGNYTLSFEAFGCNATNSADPGTLPSAGDVVAFLTGKDNVDITNTAAAGDATFHNVSFTFDVTTANTAYEFGIKKLANGSKIDWCQIKNVKLTLNSTDIFAVVNNSVDPFVYSGSQTWHTNTWSTEGQGDGSRFQVPFHELWVANGGKLADATIKGTYTPAESGVYKVSAWVRAVNESGGAISGAQIFVGDTKADACSGSPVMSNKGRLGTFTAMADGVKDTPFEYGFELKSAEINWLAFKNVTITYLGDLPQSEIDALLSQVPTDKMSASVQTELNSKVNDLNTDKSVAAYNALASYIATANASVIVYENIATLITTYQTKANALDAAGQAAYTAAINVASSGALTQYTEGTYTNTSEAEAAFSRDYGTALRAQTTPGTDLSELITNTNLYGKEFFNKTGDVNQEITGLSNGYYLITAQAYYRAGDKRTTGTAQNAKLYGNTTEVSVVNINTYTAQNIAPSNGGTWIVPTDCKFYVPDDMTAGNYAIKTLNAYHNSVAVNVTNGTLTLGIKKESKIEYDWTYWDNFKLIYLGESLPATLTGVSGDMNSEVSSAQESAVAAYNAVSGQTVANYNAAANAIIAAEASISLYNKISEDVTAYGEEAATLDAAGQTAYANEVVSINSKYSAGSYTSFGEADEELSAALLAAVKSQGAGSDWTKIITNPSFENSDMSCWTFDNITNTGDRRESGGGSDGSYHGAFWKENYNSASDQAPGLHQSVTLPAGFYRLEFDAYNHNGSDHTWKEVQLYFGATESDKLAYNTSYKSWRTFGFEFEVTETTTANLGAKFTPTENGSIWEHVDNFRLTYLGDASANMAVNATAKWGTFCAPFAVAIPSGVTAYTCESATSGVLTLEEVATTIPANTPVILNAESGLVSTTFYGKKVANGSDELIASGLLRGNVSNSAKDITYTGNEYLLQRKNDKTGFYKMNNENTYKVGYNRCYLVMDSNQGGNAREAFFFEDDATAISTLEAAEAETGALKDGKYLIDGKIVIVKNGVKYSANGQKLN